MKNLFEANNQKALRKHDCEISILLCLSKVIIQHLKYNYVVFSVRVIMIEVFKSTVQVSGEYLHSHIREEKSYITIYKVCVIINK